MEDNFGVHQNLDRQTLRVKSDSGFQVKTLLLGFACSRRSISLYFGWCHRSHESSRSAHLCFFFGGVESNGSKIMFKKLKVESFGFGEKRGLGSLILSIAASFWSPSLIFLKHFSFKHISATTYSIDSARHKIHTFDCLVVNVAMDAKHLQQWMSPNISFLLGVICWMRVAIAASTLPSMAWRSSFRSVRRVPPRMQGFKGA